MGVLNELGRRLRKGRICTCSPMLWMLRADGRVLVCIHTQFACQSHLGRLGNMSLTTNHCLIFPFYHFFSSRGTLISPPVFPCFRLSDRNPKQSCPSKGTEHSLCAKHNSLGMALSSDVQSCWEWCHTGTSEVNSVIRRLSQPNFIALRQDVSFLRQFVFA